MLSRDEIAFDRVDPHAKVGGPVERPLNLVVFTLGLEDDPAVVRGDVGSTNVGHDAKLLSELVNNRLFNQLAGKGELDSTNRHYLPPKLTPAHAPAARRRTPRPSGQ